MAKTATEPARPRRRLTAEARKSSILAPARRAFTETGDMNGTTIKLIASRSGISEGVIYRHFESKDQLFFEAIVEPLQRAVDELVAAAELIDRDEPLTPERQLSRMTWAEVLPVKLLRHQRIAEQHKPEQRQHLFEPGGELPVTAGSSTAAGRCPRSARALSGDSSRSSCRRRPWPPQRTGEAALDAPAPTAPV